MNTESRDGVDVLENEGAPGMLAQVRPSVCCLGPPLESKLTV